MRDMGGGSREEQESRHRTVRTVRTLALTLIRILGGSTHVPRFCPSRWAGIEMGAHRFGKLPATGLASGIGTVYDPELDG